MTPDAFQGAFLEPLAPYLDRVGFVLIEFGTFSKASYAEPKAFFDDLDGFLRRLPRGFQYATVAGALRDSEAVMISEEALRELEKWRREQQELTDRIGRGLNEHAQRRSEQIMGEPLLIPSELEDGDDLPAL